MAEAKKTTKKTVKTTKAVTKAVKPAVKKVEKAAKATKKQVKKAGNKLSKLIRPGIQVLVLTGKDKGKKGKVQKVDRKKMKVTVEGINVAVDYNKPLRTEDGQLRREKTEKLLKLDISNIKII